MDIGRGSGIGQFIRNGLLYKVVSRGIRICSGLWFISAFKGNGNQCCGLVG